MPKILQTIRQGQIGGGESHLLNVVENLDRTVFDPIVLSFTDGPMIDRLKEMNVPVEVIPTTTPFDIRVWGKVKKFMQQHQIALVHAHGTRSNSNIFWAANQLQIPIVYTIHGWSFHDDQPFWLRKGRIWGEQILTSNAAQNISVSQANQNAGKKYLKNFQSEIVHYGIDQQKFNPQRTFTDHRARLGIAAEATLVLFVARFTHQKQPQIALSAFAKAAAKDPSLTLWMVGDGELKAETLALAAQLEINDKVIFESFRTDIPDVLAAADIYILPSLWEGLPIGLLEAMAMGKAIVASAVDGTPEVLTNHQNGILIEVSQLEEQLANGILTLSSDPELAKIYGQKANETVTQLFSAPVMTRHIEQIYHRLLKK